MHEYTFVMDSSGFNPSAAAQADANLRALIESTDDLIWSVDPDFRLLTFNRAAQEAVERTFGVRAEVGMRLNELFPPERAALWPPLYERALVEGPFRSEFSLLDGRTLELSFNPILHGGKTVGISVFGKDMTERKQATEELAQLHRVFHSAQQAAHFGVFEWNAKTRKSVWSSHTFDLYGLDPKTTEPSAEVWLQTVHPDDRSEMRRRRQEALDSPEGRLNIEYRLADGQRWIAGTAQVYRDSDGKPAHMVGIAMDITERKRAEAAIKQGNDAIATAESHYRTIFNAVSDALFVHRLGEDGLPTTFIDVNDNACRYLGYTREELLRMRVSDINVPEDRSNVPARLQGLLNEGHLMWEGTHIAKDGRRIPIEGHTHLIEADGVKTVISSIRNMSDRKAAQKQYQDIFEGAIEGIYRISLDGRALAANPAFAKMLGYDSPNELVSTMTDTTRHLWLDPGERQRFLQLLDTHEVVRDYECQYKRKDDTPIWVSLSCRRVYGSEGTALYTEGFIEDITERKRMEHALRRSEDKFATAFKASPALTALFKSSPTGNRIVDINEAYERDSGYRREEVIGRTSEELGRWADPDELDRAMKLFRADGRVRNFEARLRSKDGSIRIGLVSAESIELDGKPGAIVTSIDVTELKKTDATMRSLVTAIENAEEEIVVTDTEATIQYCNPSFERVTGYSRGDALGRNPRILQSEKHDQAFCEQFWATLTSGKAWRGRLSNKRKGTLHEEEATISPIRDDLGRITGCVAIKRDMTERLQLEAQLRQAQKLETVGRLAGGVAHDFNNLLTIINGYSDFLIKRLKAPDPLRAYALEIRSAGELAAGLTSQLLALSRKQVIEPKLVDLNASIRESASMLQRLLGEDVVLKTYLDGSLSQVMADPDQIHQVLINLVVNARDAMPDGGTLDIQTMNVDLSEEECASIHPDAVQGRYVLLTITDTGEGMGEDIRQHIFEPFFTTKVMGKGTGLGLATVYGVVRQNGGWIVVKSDVGVGSSFAVYLPRVEACAVPEQEEAGASVDGGKETILLVEDDEGVRAFTKAALEQFGYSVIEASSGADAVAVARQHSRHIDLLLTDVVMRGMNGKDLSRTLGFLRPGLKVLFVSGYTADVISRHGVLDPGIAYIPKPFSADGLAAKVREVLAASNSKANM